MTIAEQLRAAVAASNDLDRTFARQVGQHIDTMAASLQDLRSIEEAKALAPANIRSLPRATAEELGQLGKVPLKGIATQLKLPGRSKPKNKAQLVAFLLNHGAPMVPTHEQLLDFWLSHR